MKSTLTKLSSGVSLLALSASPILAGNNDPGPTIGTGPLQVKRLGDTGIQSLGRLLSAAFGVAVLIAVIWVFAQLIMGGYAWISAGGDKAKVEEARTRITNALIGLAIVAAAWALIIVIGQFFGVSITSLSLPSATGENTAGTTAGGLN